MDNSTKDLKFIFNNLIPFTTYDVYVGAETSAGVGPKANLTIFTPAGGRWGYRNKVSKLFSCYM